MAFKSSSTVILFGLLFAIVWDSFLCEEGQSTDCPGGSECKAINSCSDPVKIPINCGSRKLCCQYRMDEETPVAATSSESNVQCPGGSRCEASNTCRTPVKIPINCGSQKICCNKRRSEEEQ